jgi:hypothetical protein
MRRTNQRRNPEWTHTFSEAGNGFPSDGELVIEEGDMGWHKLMRVVETSRIHTSQWRANTIYLLAEDAEENWDDYSDKELDEMWEDLHHIDPIGDDRAVNEAN